VDGAYHAGVLRALHEAGVKIDLAAGRGVGAIGALLFALDGAAALWEPHGLWRRPAPRAAYGLTWRYRAIGVALAAAGAAVVSPLLLLAAAAVVWPVALLAGWLGLDGMVPIASAYADWLGWAFAADRVPSWVARIVLVVVAVLVAALAAGAAIAAWRSPRRQRGAWVWRLLGPPMDSATFAAAATSAVWDLLRGGAARARPRASEISQRLVELLIGGTGQPGHRDLLVTVHDLDARRDLVFGLMHGEAGRRLFPGAAGPAARRTEAFDLAGAGRGSLIDVVGGAVTVAELSAPHALTFAPDGVWRGEAHRIADRPAALVRLLEEAASAGIEQAIIVTAAPEPAGPHALLPPRLDPRGRAGEWIASQESAAVRDAVRYAQAHFHAVFVIRPEHNPLLPFDLAGVHDEASDRQAAPADLLARGHEDAHRIFIEPALGAAGERLGAETRGHA
jgi:hypothetical protein